MGEDDCCIECLTETARSTVSADSYRDGRTSMRELAELALAGKCRDGELYYVSKSWYVGNHSNLLTEKCAHL